MRLNCPGRKQAGNPVEGQRGQIYTLDTIGYLMLLAGIVLSWQPDPFIRTEERAQGDWIWGQTKQTARISTG